MHSVRDAVEQTKIALQIRTFSPSDYSILNLQAMTKGLAGASLSQPLRGQPLFCPWVLKLRNYEIVTE